MRRFAAGLVSCTILFQVYPLQAKQLSLSVAAESAILMNAETGSILYEKQAFKPQFPASITKTATALYALKMKGDQLDTLVAAEQDSIASVSEAAIRRANYKLPSHWVEQGSSHIGIKKGEELAFRDLLYGMMLPSANDAANVIAQFVSGSVPRFVEEMNAYLKTIGCYNTTFQNPHGLHHPNHQTTAFEMALIAREALKNPTFCEIVASERYTRPKTNKQESSTIVQLNKLLRRGKFFYPKAIGIKTGHTSIAQNTFIGAARYKGRTLIAVLLKVKERSDIFTDSIKLFEAAFNEPKVKRTLLKAGEQNYALNLSGAEKAIQGYIEQEVTIEYYPAEEPSLKSYLVWEKLTLPVKKDQKIGEIIIKNEKGPLVKKVALHAKEDVNQTWFSWLKSFVI